MINALWIAKTGMQAQQNQLDVISNNLANVSTNGYKRANAVFEDLMYQNLRQVGASTSEQSQLPTGLQVGLGVRTAATQRSFAQGNLQQSGNPMDIAINGHGFFQVALPDGTQGYTRDGAFQVDAQGRLVTSSGYPLSDNITIPANANPQLKNVAAVTVTADLPAFSKTGQTIDITVSSIGNAASLRGGTLLMTPLKGADNKIYAMAQGSLLVGGAGAASGGAAGAAALALRHPPGPAARATLDAGGRLPGAGRAAGRWRALGAAAGRFRRLGGGRAGTAPADPTSHPPASLTSAMTPGRHSGQAPR